MVFKKELYLSSFWVIATFGNEFDKLDVNWRDRVSREGKCDEITEWEDI